MDRIVRDPFADGLSGHDETVSPCNEADHAGGKAASSRTPVDLDCETVDLPVPFRLVENRQRSTRSTRLMGWSPSRRPPRHVTREVPHRHWVTDQLDGPKDPAAWALVGITAADNLAHVRSGMTYDKEYGTSCTFYEKPRRLQFMEGPNEPAVADHLEMSPRYLDFQFQPLDLVFKRADGRLIHKYPDVLIEFDDNTVRLAEIKSSSAWFNAPGVRRPLDRIDLALATQGLEHMLRIEGEVFRRDPVIEAHHAAMDARLTAYDPGADVSAVRATVMGAGGCASYGTVFAALGGSRFNAEDKLYAMLLRRIVSFDLFALPTPDTPVSLPRRARAYALRDLLNRFRRKVA
jgi:hypothetical protein